MNVSPKPPARLRARSLMSAEEMEAFLINHGHTPVLTNSVYDGGSTSSLTSDAGAGIPPGLENDS